MTLRPIMAGSRQGNVPLSWKAIRSILNEEVEVHSKEINKVEE